MSRKKQIARLDKLWSKAVIERDKKICQKCFKFGDNPHHVIPRRYVALRHDLNNGLTLCTDCHVNWAHKYPEGCLIQFIEEYPERYKAIQGLKYEIKVDLDKVEERFSLDVESS